MFNFIVQGIGQSVATLDSDGVVYEVVSASVAVGGAYSVVVAGSAKYENHARLGGVVYAQDKQQGISGLAIL